MAEHKDREQYLPVRKRELVELLCRNTSPASGGSLSSREQAQFRGFCEILSALYHHEFHRRLEQLKDSYALFDPDRDTRCLEELAAEQQQMRLDALFKEFHSLLMRGNFIHLDREQLESATRSVSPWGINLDVDFGVFERLEVYYRGDEPETRPRRVWWKPWVTEDIPVRVLKRLVLIFKQKPHKRLGKHADTKSVILKLFKDIPRVDMEMLLPGGRVKMPVRDRGKLGASFLSAVGFAAWKLIDDFANIAQSFARMNPLALYGPISLLAGYGYKQYAGYQYTKRQYASRLTESLYYQSLDSNAGVLYRLLDDAEEQECREAFLAYYYLWRNAPAEGWTAAELDDFVEMDLERTLRLTFDFEVEDALAKLERLALVSKDDERYRAAPMERALEIVDEAWDTIFRFHQPSL